MKNIKNITPMDLAKILYNKDGKEEIKFTLQILGIYACEKCDFIMDHCKCKTNELSKI
jgi:hypothetical protein